VGGSSWHGCRIVRNMSRVVMDPGSLRRYVASATLAKIELSLRIWRMTHG
jgi:hypothetical protein